ncbi:hypothetical protein BKA61DRAFT_710809 [Leptodontidium sp. MPI-SDFR-AT-0119]|nr:hypothetical protein BKA61DRAFT_710809 [Leptodontidium sp. MPI-SDFR-AT-0119]
MTTRRSDRLAEHLPWENEIRRWHDAVYRNSLQQEKLKNINRGPDRFSGQTITDRGYLMFRVLRAPPRDQLRQEEPGEERTDVIDVEKNTNTRDYAVPPNTPPRPTQTSSNAPGKPRPKDRQLLSFPTDHEPSEALHNPKALDNLRSFLMWIRLYPDLDRLPPESRSSAQILGAFAIVWVAFGEAWLTKSSKRPQRYPDPAPQIILELSNDSTSSRIKQPDFTGAIHPFTTPPTKKFYDWDGPESESTKPPPNESPAKGKAASLITEFKTCDMSPLTYFCVLTSPQDRLGLDQEEKGTPYRSQTESVQKRLVLGETDAGLNAYFCACIDGFQRGVPITHSDFLELKNHDPNLPTWDKVELLIEYASILEAKAASRGGTKPQWKSQQVDQVRRQEGAEIAALAYTNRHLLIARAKRSRSHQAQLLFSVANGMVYLTIAEMPLAWLEYINNCERTVDSLAESKEFLDEDDFLRLLEYGPWELNEAEHLEHFFLVLSLLVKKTLEKREEMGQIVKLTFLLPSPQSTNTLQGLLSSTCLRIPGLFCDDPGSEHLSP